VVQQGSLEEGEMFVTVMLQHGGKQLKAELLLDTGCNMDLNISDYKADQLGLPQPSKRAAQLELGNKQIGAVRLR
jgi:predicted aspartyl protease